MCPNCVHGHPPHPRCLSSVSCLPFIPVHAGPRRPRGDRAVVSTLHKLSDGTQVSRSTNWCQEPPAPLGLLLQSQLGPTPGATLEGCRQKEAMFILLWLFGSLRAGRALLFQLLEAGGTWPKQGTCTRPEPQDLEHRFSCTPISQDRKGDSERGSACPRLHGELLGIAEPGILACLAILPTTTPSPS